MGLSSVWNPHLFSELLSFPYADGAGGGRFPELFRSGAKMPPQLLDTAGGGGV